MRIPVYPMDLTDAQKPWRCATQLHAPVRRLESAAMGT